jgi:hypothetical protein
MTKENPVRVLFLAGEDGRFGKPLQEYLKATRQIRLAVRSSSLLPEDLDDYRVLLL